MVSVAKGAGSFLGGLFNNPGIIAIAAIGIGLFLFRNQISQAFASVGESLSNLGNINIGLPEISLPEINLPQIELPQLPDITLPSLSDIMLPAIRDILPISVDPARQDVPFGDTGQIIDVVPDFGGRGSNRPSVIPEETRTGAGEGSLLAAAQNMIQRIMPGGQPVTSLIPTQQEFQSFQGSGFVFETPLENLSLNQIINNLGVTASQAVNLRAFGTDPNISNAFTDVQPQIFGNAPGFEGLTPEAIAKLLTGGNINNF